MFAPFTTSNEQAVDFFYFFFVLDIGHRKLTEHLVLDQPDLESKTRNVHRKEVWKRFDRKKTHDNSHESPLGKFAEPPGC